MEELPRRERERLLHQTEVLEAAERLFSQKGYHGTTMQEIADEAEFSVGALYNMFESKEDLFCQLVETRTDQYLQTVAEKMDAGTEPVERIRTAVATKLAFFREHEAFFRIFHEFGSDERPKPPFAGLEKHVIGKYMQYEQKLQAVFEEGIREGIFVDRNPALMASCLEGMSNALIARWIHLGASEAQETQSEEIASMFFHGVLAEGKEG